MIISAKTIVTGDSKTVLHDSAIYFEGGTIKGIGSIGELKQQFPEAEVKEYGDATILPGLIDLHVHSGGFMKPEGELNSAEMLPIRSLIDAKQMLLSGVTTYRDTGSPPKLTYMISVAAKRGLVQAPRIGISGPAICSTGGHGWRGNITREVDGIENLRAAVRLLVREGSRFIKVMTSHRSDVSEYTQDELNAVVDEAHRLGCKIAVHSSRQPSLQMVIDAGFDSIEHGCDITPEQAEQMVAKGIAWVPTLYVHRISYDRLVVKISELGMESLTERELQTYTIYGPANERFERYFKQFADMGMLIATGTDTASKRSVTPVAEEAALMVQYGKDAVWAIGASTLNAARVMGMEDQFGEIAIGKAADILVVKGDATADISALTNICQVYQAGKGIMA